jgi:D-alanine-D-alanine ligase
MERRRRRFQRVAVLKGGPSEEREVSLRSGAAVAAGLREAGYRVAEIDVRGARLNLPRDTEAVFIVLHGAFGEDGQIQQLLDERGLPYTGSGTAACRTSFDKRLSKEVFRRTGIPTPDYELLGPGQAPTLPLPVVVKPPCQGSTIGVHRVAAAAEWDAALTDALRFGNEVVVETYIPGRELTVGVVGATALPPIEIRALDGWYDYRAKYASGGQTQYLVPAPVGAACAARCQELALAAFRELGCRGFARVDFRLAADGGLYVLELNNIPGFTATSLLPKAALAAGIAFPALCDRIMQLAALG